MFGYIDRVKNSVGGGGEGWGGIVILASWRYDFIREHSIQVQRLSKHI